MLFLKSGCAISTNNVRLCALKPPASIVIGTVPSNILSHHQNSHTHVQKTHDGKTGSTYFLSSLALLLLQTSFLFFATKHNSVPHVGCQSLSSVLSDARLPVCKMFGGGGGLCMHPPILTGKAKKKRRENRAFYVIPRLCHNMTEHTVLSKLSANKKRSSQTERDKAAIQVSAHCLPPWQSFYGASPGKAAVEFLSYILNKPVTCWQWTRKMKKKKKCNTWEKLFTENPHCWKNDKN